MDSKQVLVEVQEGFGKTTESLDKMTEKLGKRAMVLSGTPEANPQIDTVLRGPDPTRRHAHHLERRHAHHIESMYKHIHFHLAQRF